MTVLIWCKDMPKLVGYGLKEEGEKRSDGPEGQLNMVEGHVAYKEMVTESFLLVY